MSSAERLRTLVWLGCLLAIAVLGARWLVSEGGGSGARGSLPARSAGTAVTLPRQGSVPPAQTDIVVHVAGQVRHPGIYRLHAGARVYEAMQAAGGATRHGDPNALELAARLTDGQKVSLPARGQVSDIGSDAAGGSGGAPPAVGSAGSGPVSIATATVEQLDALDGIGPALARRIVDWRSRHGGFASINDLDKVPGIGPAKLAALRGAVVP